MDSIQAKRKITILVDRYICRHVENDRKSDLNWQNNDSSGFFIRICFGYGLMKWCYSDAKVCDCVVFYIDLMCFVRTFPPRSHPRWFILYLVFGPDMRIDDNAPKLILITFPYRILGILLRSNPWYLRSFIPISQKTLHKHSASHKFCLVKRLFACHIPLSKDNNFPIFATQ